MTFREGFQVAVPTDCSVVEKTSLETRQLEQEVSHHRNVQPYWTKKFKERDDIRWSDCVTRLSMIILGMRPILYICT